MHSPVSACRRKVIAAQYSRSPTPFAGRVFPYMLWPQAEIQTHQDWCVFLSTFSLQLQSRTQQLRMWVQGNHLIVNDETTGYIKWGVRWVGEAGHLPTSCELLSACRVSLVSHTGTEQQIKVCWLSKERKCCGVRDAGGWTR